MQKFGCSSAQDHSLREAEMPLGVPACSYFSIVGLVATLLVSREEGSKLPVSASVLC